MFEIGRICVKIAGRDAGLKCAVVEILDNNFVVIDGQTRRRKCNTIHLEPLDEIIKINPKASHEEIVSEFSRMNIEIIEKKPRQAAAERPKKIRKRKEQPSAEAQALADTAAKEQKKPAKKKEARK